MVLVTNERVKAASGVFFNLGTALLIAAVVRSYQAGTIDWPAAS